MNSNFDIPNWEWQITPRFEQAFDFSEGLASVQYSQNPGSEPDTYTFVDELGDVVLQGEGTANPFSNGLSKCYKSVNETGYIDLSGSTVIPYSYSILSGDFENDIVNLRVSESGNAAFGFMKRNGKWLLPPQFYRAASFSDGRARVQSSKKSFPEDYYSSYYETTWIDPDGKKILSPVAHGGDFSEGRASAMASANHLRGYIDIDGKWVIKPQFHFVSDFTSGIALVGLAKDGDRWWEISNYWLIDTAGHKVSNLIKPLKGHATSFGMPVIDDSHLLMTGDNTDKHPSRLFTRDGKLILQDSDEWTMVDLLGSLSWVRAKGDDFPRRHGLINVRGEYVIPPIFSRISKPGSSGLISAAVPVWSDEEVWDEDESEYSKRGWVHVYGYGKPITGLA